MAILQPVQRVRGVLPVKRSRVRRSLAFSGEIGEGNTKHNIQFAERLSTISAEDCAKKWNFDVNKGVPIAGGRFSWSLNDPNAPLDLTPPPVTPDVGGQKGQRSEGADAGVKSSSACVGGDGAAPRSRDEATEGHSEVRGQEKEEAGLTKGRREAEERRGEYGGKRRREEDEEEDVLPPSPSSSSSSAAVTASASSSSSSSSPLRQTSIAEYTREKKKRKTTPTPQTPNQSPHKKVLLQIRA